MDKFYLEEGKKENDPDDVLYGIIQALSSSIDFVTFYGQNDE